jgi:hypothetical protein
MPVVLDASVERKLSRYDMSPAQPRRTWLRRFTRRQADA